MKTIAEIYGQKMPETYRPNINTAPEIPNNTNQTLYFGLELELENVTREWGSMMVPGMLQHVEDGSLRNGREFILRPQTLRAVSSTLRKFFGQNNITLGNYSERCSTHVHANVQNLTREQVSSICLLYQLYERVLFTFIGNDREDNIFCVPWYASTVTYERVAEYLAGRDDIVDRAEKYTALNLRPICTQGTMEFRHLHGTCDVEFILNWLRIIGAIFAYATKHTLEEIQSQITQLNTTSLYLKLTRDIFNDLLYPTVPNIEPLLEDGVVDVKHIIYNQRIRDQKREATLDAIQARQNELLVRMARANGIPGQRNAMRFDQVVNPAVFVNLEP